VSQWVPKSAELVLDMKAEWYNIPEGAPADAVVAAYESLERLFQCIAARMTLLLRSCVERSLSDFTNAVLQYADGNAFTGAYTDATVKQPSLLRVQVEERDGVVVLQPSAKEIRARLEESCAAIALHAAAVPRIESRVFPALADEQRTLRWGETDDARVVAAQAAVARVAASNVAGPVEYLHVFDQYASLLVPKGGVSPAEREVMALLEDEERPLEVLGAHVEKLRAQAEEILALRRSVPLNLVNLDCSPLQEYLAAQARRLATLVLDTVCDRGRRANRSTCERFDAMAMRLMERPADTEQMTQLDGYLQTVKTELIFKLKSEIRTMGERLRFLSTHGALTPEDIALNTMTLKWPERVEPMFEVTQRRVDESRQGTETTLKTRVAEFEKQLEDYCAQIEAFREKTDGLRPEEINRNVKVLETLKAGIEEAKREADRINREQELLEWEITNFTQIQHVVVTAEPFEKLWTIAQQFNVQKDRWFDGPFLSLDAESISEELGNMWRIMYKLTKTFSDAPGPQKTAESLKGKMDKFKQYVPLLQCICNKGLRTRHWERISDLTGFDIQPDETTSLSQMLAMNVDKFLEQLEEISSAASKEYSLDKALRAMQSEWADIMFALIPYRDTGVSILSGVDEVQVLLDDHIVKTQTMRGSPFIKPFEAEIVSWETKLVSMQVCFIAWLWFSLFLLAY
jgi:dynein heavy chain